MKNKLLVLAFAAALVSSVFADEAEDSVDEVFDTTQPVVETPRKNVGVWPAYFVVGEIPSVEKAPDVIGLRLTIPFSTEHDNVTGFDLGFWGRALYYEGFMLNLLRNDAKDQFSGFQVGIYNSAAQANVLAVQVGLWNEAGSIRGVQAGLVNTVALAQGFQIGLINRAEELYGFQIGAINVIRDAELPFFPLVNIGF